MEVSDWEVPPGELARREAWALAHGMWLWRWPEVAPADWRKALMAIEAAVRDVLAGRPAILDPAVDLRALSLAGYTSGIGPLLGYWIAQDAMEAPDDVAALFALHLAQNTTRMDRLAEVGRDISRLFIDAGIRVAVLKGMYLAFDRYPHPATRPVSDIDLLVWPPDQAAAAQALLARTGFLRIYGNFKETTWVPVDVSQDVRSLLMVHAENPWAIDLHHSIDQRHCPGSAMTRFDDSVGDYLGSTWGLCPEIAALSPPALLLHLASHAGSSLRINISLIRLIDIILVVREQDAAGGFDWAAFLHLARRTDSLPLAYAPLALSERLAPGTVPATILAICEASVPKRVRRLVAACSPGTAQRLDRMLMSEHFAWIRSPGDAIRQIWATLLPEGFALRQMGRRYWRLMKGFATGAIVR